ncbi:MAG TPA: 3-oxoacyl-[acyl-carrier-protein] reductase [Desulfurivibrio alkaliphilus]|uniref:3-oxoacyl-[acyl-carrier-protein] reductase n=1 Tax=Desulfurivibrio alkaliphilus TaxID=427923 RepID=A0A7C2TJ94_9BACT|nr:3-oxoacyl-[acyl-carrier-protein] reductase [Desulfurivibrio alkaliphilus]
MSLQGKVAVVTGGSRGIGRAVSLRLGAMGALVVVNYVSRPDAAEETAAQIRAAGGQAEICAFNVADTEGTEEAFKKILAAHGRIDILVNNAGITRDGLMVKMKESQWDEVLDTNLKGAFTCLKAVSRAMMKQRWGRIVNISSVIGFAGNAGQLNYAAAKAGLVGLTRSAARELASRNITVNGVAPGYIVTDMTRDLPEEINEKIRGEIPLGLLGEPEDVAGAVAYLVSEDGRYLTGQFIHVNGGMYMG